MEVRLLDKQEYKNNKEFYKDFLDDNIKNNEEYFSNEVIELDEAPDFPIYMGVSVNKEDVYRYYNVAFRVLGDHYIKLDKNIYFDETFWHSLFTVYKRDYLLSKYPEIKNGYNTFKRIVLKNFDWENYIYKCLMVVSLAETNFNNNLDKNNFYKLIIDNLDLFNYTIKLAIFRNTNFLENIFSIIGELNLSNLLKSKILSREDLNKDIRYGREMLLYFNRNYPVIMYPTMTKEELKVEVLKFLDKFKEISINKNEEVTLLRV